MKNIVFTAENEYTGITLRDFLRRRGVSAAYLQRIKQSGEYISVNGERAYSNTRIRGKDTVLVPITEENGFTDEPPQNLNVEIIYEDDYAIVFNKPPYMAVHPTLGYKDGTLANHFCFLMRERGQKGIFRPLNRLDRNTSGAVLCAKHSLFVPFLQKETEKEYICIVKGQPENEHGVIQVPIARCADSIVKRRADENGKYAYTEYTVVSRTKDFSVLKVRLKTGRTHQIRVHMAYISHPLLGDGLYGGDIFAAPRQFLHCSYIEFTLPDNTKKQLNCPVWQDMREFCEKEKIYL